VSDTAPEPVGTLKTALENANRLLIANPRLAEQQAWEILKAIPDQPHALLIFAKARRLQGDTAGAIETLNSLARTQPRSATVLSELGATLAANGDLEAAVATLRRAVKIDPGQPAAWRALGDALTLAGDTKAASDAHARQIRASVNDPRLVEAALALCDNKLAVAEKALKTFLKAHPTDVVAIRMLAETGARLGRLEDSANLLERCVELAPGFSEARHNYAVVLHRLQRSQQALQEVDALLKDDAKNPNYLALKAAILVHLGDHERAIACYEGFLASHGRQPKSWMSYGHALKAVGRQSDCIAAYRRSIALLPSLGEVWWSLANLKTYRFSEEEIDQMRSQVGTADLSDEDRFHLHFALGKALEDAGSYEGSFEHYREGNALRGKAIRYRADDTTKLSDRSIAFFTRSFFDKHRGTGNASSDPIFVVGLPRSGSTLVEQILSSHSTVEGTTELPDILSIARRLGGKRSRLPDSEYPEMLARLDDAEFRRLGEEYLERVKVQRRQGRIHFVDKMPNNFQHVGLIHLILPHAKIIDTRRHPLGCCFSNFKQHFARGQNFTYGLEDIGRYYSDYVRLMAHYDAVLPGRVHRVVYERMVEDPENEIRNLLSYCELPFEPACLKFYETERAVRTASSEQVRLPIFTEAVDQWRNYERWLGPLKDVLGAVLAAYPGVPNFSAATPGN
jgi:tetratricopeptide (TPR) repeat protein